MQQGLGERGHDVQAYHLESFGLPRQPRARLLAQRLAMPRYLSRFGARLNLSDFDAVMSSSGMAAPLFAQLRARAERPVLVNHLHGLAVYDHLAVIKESTLGHEPTGLAFRLINGPIQNR